LACLKVDLAVAVAGVLVLGCLIHTWEGHARPSFPYGAAAAAVEGGLRTSLAQESMAWVQTEGAALPKPGLEWLLAAATPCHVVAPNLLVADVQEGPNSRRVRVGTLRETWAAGHDDRTVVVVATKRWEAGLAAKGRRTRLDNQPAVGIEQVRAARREDTDASLAVNWLRWSDEWVDTGVARSNYCYLPPRPQVPCP
jgi:hypothetical protein